MSDDKTILYQKQRSGVLITLNRPKALNAMNEELMGELDRALAEAETDPEIRGVIITGAGGAFSVGEDVSGEEPPTAWPYGVPEGTSLNAAYNKFRDADRKDILQRQLYRWQYPKPIIAAVSGWCLGAGASLALTCHVTIAADDAVFGQPQVRHGLGSDQCRQRGDRRKSASSSRGAVNGGLSAKRRRTAGAGKILLRQRRKGLWI